MVECIELQEIVFVEIKLRLITDILMIRIKMHFLIGFLENRGSLLTVCLGLGSGLLKGTVRVVLSVHAKMSMPDSQRHP